MRGAARVFLSLGAAIGAAAWMAGCSSANRRGEPFTRDLNVSNSRLAMGQQVFYQHCNVCHPGGSAGYGPSLNQAWLADWYIRFRVRGGLGAMPSFDEHVIPDGQLDELVLYVQAVHNLGG